MPDPATYRPASGEIPDAPGVYRFRDPHGRVVYVGKARSLRSRLSSYFQDLAALHPRTARMVTTAASVEWTVVSNEVEALQLEYAWIKEYDPRFNVKYRDDKSYPYLAVSMGEEFPRAQVMRGDKRKGVRYFGPYAHAWAIRETLDLLLHLFPVRTCSAGVFKRATASGRPCLLGYIDKCSAPCVGRVSAETHRAIAEDLCSVLGGATRPIERRLEAQMHQAAESQNYERAAQLRDDLLALRRVMERSAVVLGERTDADVFGVAEDDLEIAVQVFHVRGGRIRGQRGWVAERETEATAGLVASLIVQVYGGESGEAIPREVLVPVAPDGVEALTPWLAERRGGPVSIRVPMRGDKKALLGTVSNNAVESLARHKLARSGDLAARSQALTELQQALSLSEPPLRIEAFDISHVQGTNAVGSMVVFEDGLARKSEYRHFVIAGGSDTAADDTAAMNEVLTRRFRRYLDSGADEAGRAKGGFSYPPALVVVDGGLPQVHAAASALREIGVAHIPVVGLAKRLEEVWVPGEEFPVVLPRSSEGLYLLQRVRDEAHRFAISFHRQRRSAAMVASELDDIAGLGPARTRALLEHFGSVKVLRTQSAESIAAVSGIGPTLAAAIAAKLAAKERPAPGVNLTTGEVVDDEAQWETR